MQSLKQTIMLIVTGERDR